MHNRRLRQVSALVSFFSFMIVGSSGLVMLLWPGGGGGGGRGRGGTGIEVFGLDRHVWSEVHEMGAIVFLVAALIHLSLNWGPMKRHLGFGGSDRLGRDFR